MKKILVLAILCLSASLSNAAVDIYLTNAAGQTSFNVAPSSTATLYLWSTGDILTGFDNEVGLTSGPGSILGGAITAIGRDTIYDGVLMPGISGYDIEVTAGCDLGSFLSNGLANPLATITFKCLQKDATVHLDLYDDGTFVNQQAVNPTFHGATISQIPEPATMLLLTLGGLAIRRFRK